MGDGFSSLSSWGKAHRGNNGRGAGMTWEGDGRFANRPYEGGSGWIACHPVFTGGRLCAGMTRGWVPASARTREGMMGDGFPSRLHGGRLFAGMTRGWVPASARTRVGMGSRPCLHGGRLFAGIDEGMGPRIREDTGGGGGWVPVPVFMGEDSARALARGWVPASARTREGMGQVKGGGAASSGGFLRR